MEPELVLYIRKTCPYCQKVLAFMEEDGIELPLRDLNEDPGASATLLEVGGKVQVPCLFIDGKPLYESLDIIEWLKENIA